MKITARKIKDLFNGLASQNLRDMKYKRTIQNSTNTVMIEVVNNTALISTSFYCFKLLYFVPNSKKAIYTCNHKDIENMYKYNLKNI